MNDWYVILKEGQIRAVSTEQLTKLLNNAIILRTVYWQQHEGHTADIAKAMAYDLIFQGGLLETQHETANVDFFVGSVAEGVYIQKLTEIPEDGNYKTATPAP